MKQMTKIWVFSLGLFVMAISNICSQNNLFTIKKTALWFGTRQLTVDSLAHTSDLDFLDNVRDYNFGEYFYLGASIQLGGDGPWQMDLKIFTSDDIFPNSLNMGLQYKLNRYFGLQVGLYSYPILFESVSLYHVLRDQDFITDRNNDSGNRQRVLYDLGLIAGPIFNLDIGPVFIGIKLNAGYGNLFPFTEGFPQKKINSNFRREIVYNAGTSSGLFFFPEIELGLDVLHFNTTSFGFQLQANTYIAQRRINYKRTIRNWTQENVETQLVSSPLHSFRKTDIDFGIYWKF